MLSASFLATFSDFTCPFSKKQLFGVNEHLLPLLGNAGQYANKVRILLRPYPQPWHSTSPLLTEAAVAVARLAKPRGTTSEYEAEWQKLCNAEENAAWVFAKALFEEQEKYFDGPARNKNADQVRATLRSPLAGRFEHTCRAGRSLMGIFLVHAGGTTDPVRLSFACHLDARRSSKGDQRQTAAASSRKRSTFGSSDQEPVEGGKGRQCRLPGGRRCQVVCQDGKAEWHSCDADSG